MGDDTMGISEAQASSSAVGSSSSFLSIDWGDNEECPICRKPLGTKSVAMPDCCSHFFCYACIKSWVTKSKSNCPMDRMDILQLKIFDSSGKFKRTEKVEAKEQEDDVEFDLDDEGICPDCGWMGMRASVGVCLHCMYHVDSPFPVQNCPQCMENDANYSDEEWTPQTASDLQLGNRRRNLRSDNNQHVILEAPARASGASSNRRRRRAIEDFIIQGESDEESDHSVNLQSLLEGESESDSASEPENEEVVDDVDFAIPGPSTSRAPPVPRPVRRIVKKVTKKRRTTKVKRKRKTKTKRRKTTGTKTKRKRKVKRKKTTRGRKKVSTRPTLPDDSAKRRLAKVLGVRPPKLSGQMMPRGCKKKPVTAAQRQALADSSGPSNVYNRPVGSLDYHHSATSTLHLFGGEELEYFPSGSDSDGSSSSSCDYHFTKRAIPSSSASVIKKFKNNAIKSLRRRAHNVVAATASVAPPSDLLSSIMEGQSKKFEIKSNLNNRIDPYKMSPATVATLPPTPPKSLPTTPQKSRLQRRLITFKKSPGKEDDLDLYSDIPAAGGAGGGGDAGGEDNEDPDYFYDAPGSSGAGGDDGGDGDNKDFKKDEPSDEEEETKVEEEEDDDAEGGEEINEMVIDESVFANDELPSPAEEEAVDPLEVAPVLEAPVVEQTQPPSPPSREIITPVAYPIAVIRAEPLSAEVVRPVFRYSNTSLQIARHLTVDDEVLSDNPEEPDDYPEEPVSDVEDPLEVKSPLEKPSDEVACNVNNLPVVAVNHVAPKIENIVKVEVTNGIDLSVSISPVKKENQDMFRRSNSPSPSPAIKNKKDASIKKPPLKVKSRKKSLVEELFGSDVEENLPPRKISTDKSGPEGSEDGEIKERKQKKSETEIPPVVEPVREKSPVRQKSVERKKKKEKVKEPKKKKKERRRSRSRSDSSDRRKKHHSRKYSPARRSRKRSRSRSRKQHDENGRMSIHERLGPKRGRSRERSEDRAPAATGGADKKEVYSSGENILVSVNFSRRRKRIAEIAAKRRPVAVINLAVDDDKSPVVEMGDSPKEVINLDEGWSTDDEPVRSKHKEHKDHKEHKEQPSNKKDSSSHKSSKNKETGPKTPPEPQVKFSIMARPQLKLKNVLGVHDDDDDEDPVATQDSSKDDKSVAETYDPFNPTASPTQQLENEPPPQRLKSASHLPPNTRPLSPPKLLTEMPKLERPPPLVAPATSTAAPTPAPASAARPVTEIFPGLPANVANILCSSQLQNVFAPQLSALTMPLLLSAPCFMNMQNAVQQVVNSASLSAAPVKPDNGVVDMELESPYSPAASEGDDLFEPPSAKNANKAGAKTGEKFDNLFSQGKREVAKPSTKGSSSKAAKKDVKTSVTTSSGKKDISVKMEKNKLKIVGAVPNAAVETQVKEKFLKKLNRQERVVEEVKVALKPHYTKKLINKEEYKDILRRAVPKVCHNKSGEINPAKIKGLVNEYVKRVRHERNKTKKV